MCRCYDVLDTLQSELHLTMASFTHLEDSRPSKLRILVPGSDRAKGEKREKGKKREKGEKREKGRRSCICGALRMRMRMCLCVHENVCFCFNGNERKTHR